MGYVILRDKVADRVLCEFSKHFVAAHSNDLRMQGKVVLFVYFMGNNFKVLTFGHTKLILPSCDKDSSVSWGLDLHYLLDFFPLSGCMALVCRTLWL